MRPILQILLQPPNSESTAFTKVDGSCMRYLVFIASNVNPNDVISSVASCNQYLVANLESWNFPRLSSCQGTDPGPRDQTVLIREVDMMQTTLKGALYSLD